MLIASHKFLQAMLQKLLSRAQAAHAAYRAGLSGESSTAGSHYSEGPDELEVLGGLKTVITAKSSSNSPTSNYAASPPGPMLISGDHNENTTTMDPDLYENYYRPGHPYVDTQANMLGPYASTSGNEYAGRAMTSQNSDYGYTPGHYYTQQTPYIQVSNQDSQHPSSTSAGPHTQADIWQEFIGHLGVNKP